MFPETIIRDIFKIFKQILLYFIEMVTMVEALLVKMINIKNINIHEKEMPEKKTEKNINPIQNQKPFPTSIHKK